MAEIFVLCGFYLIYIVDEVTHSIIDCCRGGKTKDNEGEAISVDYTHQS